MEEDRYKLPLFDGTNYGDWRFRMEIVLDEKGILTHVSRHLAELQEEFRLTGNENQETRSAEQKKLDKLSTDDKKCKKINHQVIYSVHHQQAHWTLL
jgi:predicted secreted protein